jgi:hypothetical protein
MSANSPVENRTHKNVADQPKPLDSKRAAEILGRSPSTLKRWRAEGLGPKYVRIRGRVRYHPQVLDDFIRDHECEPVRAASEENS